MFLSQLDLHAFRSFTTRHYVPHPQCNFIVGANGSGKSSLLEAIYVLAMGRSFRCHQLTTLIEHGAERCQLLAEWQNEFGRRVKVGVAKQRQQSGTEIRLNGRALASLAELVRLVPVQLINHDSFHLLDAGPQCRRQFLDWGVFHVEPTFYSAWQRYQRALKQYHAALKQSLPLAQVALWHQELSEQAAVIHALRERYMHAFLPHFEAVLQGLIALPEVRIQYYPGWAIEHSLAEVLTRHYPRDKQVGHSQYGPQRADLKIKSQGLDADLVLSRGQQKMVSYALRLAQSQLLKQWTGKSSVFLIDDLPAELDAERMTHTLQLLLDLRCQLFVTAVDEHALLQACQRLDYSMFHVERLK